MHTINQIVYHFTEINLRSYIDIFLDTENKKYMVLNKNNKNLRVMTLNSVAKPSKNAVKKFNRKKKGRFIKIN